MTRMIHTSLLVRGIGPAGQTRPCRLRLAVTLLAALTLASASLAARAFIQPASPLVRILPLGRLPDALTLDPRSGHVFVADDAAATVSLLDPAAGRILRTVSVGDPSTLAPLILAIDTRTNRLFVANRCNGIALSVVRVLDSRTGAALRSVYVGLGAAALAVDARAGRVFVTAVGDDSVSMFDARTGTVLRTIDVGLAPLAIAVDARMSRAFVVGWAIQQGREMGTGKVSVIDTRTGALIDTVAVGNGSNAVAVDASTSRAFVVNNGDNTVSVLDSRTGTVLRTVAVGWGPFAVAVDARRVRVFVVNAGGGSLSVLDARSGALLYTRRVFGEAPVGAMLQPHALAVDEARDRVYLTSWGQLDPTGIPTGSGLLAVLDARDGHIRRTIAVGVAPRAIAVDERSGQVTVVDTGGEVRAPLGWLERWRRQVVGWAPWLGRIVPRQPEATVAPSGVQVIDAAGL